MAMQNTADKIEFGSEELKFFDRDHFDYTKKYPDEFYSRYIRDFQPNTKPRRGYRIVKRILDIVISFLGLILTSPVMLIVAICIKLDSEGPVIFKQERMGKDGKIFCCYKFRSMKITAPSDCATSVLENPEEHHTRVGRIIRKLSLDELPQLWCVFIGTMSFIGYRPLVLTEVKCNDMRAQLQVFTALPGISGLAQVEGRDDVYYKNKAILDAIYVKNASISMDAKLFLKTFTVVFQKKGNRDGRSNKK